ncbi:MAG: DinB family protein [Dehalococcoidia bacterium]|nr:DinB family protein [Dehalococcoidia bacterium]
MLTRDALDELYRYTEYAWDVFAETMRGLPPGMLTQAAPGSGWPSLRDCYRHVVGAYDGWLHYSLKRGELINPPPERLGTWDGIEDYRRRTRATFRRTLAAVSDDGLAATFAGVYDPGAAPETQSLADILGNLLLHERGHHGDLSTLLYQLGQEPPFVDYRQYAVRRNAQAAQ